LVHTFLGWGRSHLGANPVHASLPPAEAEQALIIVELSGEVEGCRIVVSAEDAIHPTGAEQRVEPADVEELRGPEGAIGHVPVIEG
jgi:hypothetical protein